MWRRLSGDRYRRAVGPGGEVHGIDISESMVAAARRLASEPTGDLRLSFHVGDITHLDFADGVFDAAVAHQVYEYVADSMTALGELYRVLKPGGRALIVDSDSRALIWHSTDEALAARVLAAWDEHSAHPNLRGR